MLNRNQLAQNILHRFLEDGILGETNGQFEMLVEETLLEEIDKFSIINIPSKAKVPGSDFTDDIGEINLTLDTLPCDPPIDPKTARQLVRDRRIDRGENDA